MINKVLWEVLSADGDLKELLFGTAKKPGIYYQTKKDDKQNPYIVYYEAEVPTNLNAQKNLFEQTVTFNLYADTHTEAQIIRDRLYELFNEFDDTEYVSEDGEIRILEGHAVPGFSRSTFIFNPKTSAQTGVSFKFQFVRCAIQ